MPTLHARLHGPAIEPYTPTWTEAKLTRAVLRILAHEDGRELLGLRSSGGSVWVELDSDGYRVRGDGRRYGALLGSSHQEAAAHLRAIRARLGWSR